MTDETKNPETIDVVAKEVPDNNAPDTAQPTVRRGRGRPAKGEKTGDAENPPTPDKEIPAGTASTTAAKPKSRAKKTEINIGNLANQIVGIHQLVAMATGIGEVVISEPEAELLAKGFAAVAEQYDFEISGKPGASLQLFAAAAMVYAPRVFAIKAKIAKQKQAAANAVQSENVPGAAMQAGPAANASFPT